ncbi:SRPBCC family protein [Paracoccus pacificus]|uniref:SRPBCC family protein n=1 Tax=Paracoccus pacificus TaxID=1463598 RepID=A0ABW4RA27_9RHOB
MKSKTTIEGNDLIITRHIAASPEVIWDALTNPEKLKIWFAPRPWKITDIVLEPHPGGRFQLTMVGPDGEGEGCDPNEGCVLLVEPNRRIAWTDALAGGFRPNAKPFMTAIITLEPKDGGTQYTARALHSNGEDRQRHEEMGFAEGWGTCIEQLVEMVE